MGPDVTLDTIIKSFSIIYGNVKSYDSLMGDFYCTDQGEDETVTSFATCIEGLLSYVRDKFPNQISLAKEQQLLKDRLFHGCQKGIRDSVKFRHADSTVDYMSFLEECRKVEDEDGVGKAMSKGKVKIAAATTSSSAQNDAFAKQLKRKQQQFDTLMGKVQAMLTTLQSQNAQATSSFRQGNHSFGMRGRGQCPFIVIVGEESLEVEAFLHKVDGGGSLNHRGPTPNLILLILSRNRGMSRPTLTISVGNVGRWDI